MTNLGLPPNPFEAIQPNEDLEITLSNEELTQAKQTTHTETAAQPIVLQASDFPFNEELPVVEGVFDPQDYLDNFVYDIGLNTTVEPPQNVNHNAVAESFQPSATAVRENDMYVFGENEQVPEKLEVVNPNYIYNRSLTNFERRAMNKIIELDDYLWSRSAEGGITTGFPSLDKALDYDMPPGLYLFGAQANVGKTAYMMQLTKQIATLNDNVHVAYHALDDGVNEAVPRFVSCYAGITISQAKKPSRYTDNADVMAKRNDAMKFLMANTDRISFWDTNEGRMLTDIEEHIKDMRMQFGEERRLVIGLDSAYDVEAVFATSDKQAHEEVAKTIKSWCTMYNVVIMATAHLKKTNGIRPTIEDLKENNRLEYEANFVSLLYNEVGLKQEEAEMFWIHEGSDYKMPVIENRVAKNKVSSFKGTIFYEFLPELSIANEVTEDEARAYIARMS